MNYLMIRYQRDSDTLKIKLTSTRFAGCEVNSEIRFQYGLISVTNELGGGISIVCTIILFSKNRENALKKLVEICNVPIKRLEDYVDLVLEAHPKLSSPCFDFYMLRDGSWQGLDRTYIRDPMQ